MDGARPSRRPRRDSNSSLSSGSESAADDGGASDTVATPDFGGSSGEAEHRSRADQASSSSSSSSSEESSNEEEEAFDPYLFIKNLQSTPYGDITGGIDARICLPRKTRSAPSISLVLDLDETLVHCSVEPIAKADLTFAVPCMDGQILTVQVCQRPHLLEFLTQVAQWFEIIVFTASQRVYAEKLLNLLDPERKLIRCVVSLSLFSLSVLRAWMRVAPHSCARTPSTSHITHTFYHTHPLLRSCSLTPPPPPANDVRHACRHRLYRDSCLLVRGNGHGNYVKDLNVLGRDLSKVVIVDNSPHAFGLQPANGIPIGAWYDDAGDCEVRAEFSENSLLFVHTFEDDAKCFCEDD